MSDNKKKKVVQSNCDTCQYYSYDEEFEYYYCDANLDEDDMARFMLNQTYNCPFYKNGDEYLITRKQ